MAYAANLNLVCRVDGVLLAIPVHHVAETMRPRPVEPLTGAPPFVRGVSLIRGGPVPVVDAAALLGRSQRAPTRFVVLKTGTHRVALAVSEVVGVRELAPERLQGLPPLFGGAPADLVTSIGVLDEALLLVLESGRLVPESLWTSTEVGGSGP